MKLDAEDLGPTTRVALLMVSPRGEACYQVEGRPERRVFLSPLLGWRVFGMIDQTTSVAFIDPASNGLASLALSAPGGGMRAVSMGEQWGTWQDEEGQSHQVADMVALLTEWRAPVAIQSFKQELSIDFTINVFARHLFEEDARCFFLDDGGLRHVLAITFSYPSGRYVSSRLTLFSKQSGKLIKVNELDAFPLAWPGAANANQPAIPSASPGPFARQAPTPSSSPSSAPKQPPPANKKKPRPARRSSAMPPPPPPPFDRSGDHVPAIAQPVATGRNPFATEPEPVHATGPAPASEEASGQMPAMPVAPSMPTMAPLEPPPAFSPPPELRRVRPASRPGEARIFGPAPASRANAGNGLTAGRDPASQRAMIETCLNSGMADRVYALIQSQGERVSDVVRDWPPALLRNAFAGQPATLLAGLMQPWTVDQVMAVAEASAEPERVLDWLRDREADRLRRLRPASREAMSEETARATLNVRPGADATDVEIAWRTLRVFLTVWPAQGSPRVLAKFQRQSLALLDRARQVLLDAD